MIKWFLNFLGFSNDAKPLKSSSCSEITVTMGFSFPEYDPIEYQRQKRIRDDKALNGCEFWDGINIDLMENINFFYANKCPNCSQELPTFKSKSFKCPNCKQKIYRLKDIISDYEGLFTEKQKEIRLWLKNELNRRKRFLNAYNIVKEYIDFKPTNFKNDNIIILLGLLNEAKKYTTKASQSSKLRMCRFFEGELCINIDGYEKAALNAYLTVAYIDLWGIYILNKFETDAKIAYGIIERIRKFNYDIEILKGLFIVHAKMLEKSIKYKAPITPEEAWEKFENIYNLPDL